MEAGELGEEGAVTRTSAVEDSIACVFSTLGEKDLLALALCLCIPQQAENGVGERSGGAAW